MALAFIEGFELFGTVVNTNMGTVVTQKYPNSSATNPVHIETGRDGGYALEFGNNTNQLTVDTANTNELVLGMAVRFSTIANNGTLLNFRQGTTANVQLRTAGAGSPFNITNAAGTSYGTGTTNLAINTWYYVEIHIVFHASAGSIRLYVNEASEYTGTSLNTLGGGAIVNNVIRFQYAATLGNTMMFDDIYCLTGSSLTPLGTCKVLGILPDTDGSTTDWVPSTGSDNYAVLDDNPPNTSDYVELTSPVAGDRDSFFMQEIADIDEIFGLQLNLLASVDTGTLNLKTVCVSGVDEELSANLAVTSGANRPLRHVYEVNPDGNAAWTPGTVNSAEFGYEVGS